MVSTLDIRTGNIILRGLVEGEIDLQNELWRRFVMICEVERAVGAE